MAASSSSNPYQLAPPKKGGARDLPPRPARAAVLTEDEKREKLVGYLLVPREFWPNVKYGTHVRFIETEAKSGGAFHSAFIAQNPFDTTPRGTTTEKRFFKFQNNFYKNQAGHLEWIVAYEDVEFLYAKGEGAELALQRDLLEVTTKITANANRLAEHIKRLEARVGALEQQLESARRR
jgi:hypothetical protein